MYVFERIITEYIPLPRHRNPDQHNVALRQAYRDRIGNQTQRATRVLGRRGGRVPVIHSPVPDVPGARRGRLGDVPGFYSAESAFG